ncbi:MAG: S41 family peptidase [Pseudanabaenaceae cyanobacterium SKYGB_i_bin29]|nr:S41 family peptidase [Pseudanabaenaceae cyanobacterium SKYG29]MDW8422454.1 S41 family peptidase [Pseudanabaenaceae cyanobacterium SKYGB_i_bin29]
MIQQLTSFVLSLLLWWSVTNPALADITDYFQERQLFNHVWQMVQHAYVDPTFNHHDWGKVRKEFANRKLESREQTYAAIRDMLALLGDPFTRLLPPEEFRSMQTSTNGSLSGVGLHIATDPDRQALIVISPVEGSPADRAGIRPLDRILAIDGVPTKDLTLDECADRMRGPVGTDVTILVERDGEAPFSVTITRSLISVNPVVSKLDRVNGKQIGYLRLTQFNANAPKDMARAIENLEAQGAEGYVLDLRGNPGGLLEVAISVARLWLDEGVVVYTTDRQGIEEVFTVGENNQAMTHDPLVVLVDKGSASASEVLAGALHDNQRAKLVGEQTYGKGSIQSLFELEDGAGLAVTIAHYETPSHKNINKVGLEPDIVVKPSHPLRREELATPQDEQYARAVALLTT